MRTAGGLYGPPPGVLLEAVGGWVCRAGPLPEQTKGHVAPACLGKVHGAKCLLRYCTSLVLCDPDQHPQQPSDGATWSLGGAFTCLPDGSEEGQQECVDDALQGPGRITGCCSPWQLHKAGDRGFPAGDKRQVQTSWGPLSKALTSLTCKVTRVFVSSVPPPAVTCAP